MSLESVWRVLRDGCYMNSVERKVYISP